MKYWLLLLLLLPTYLSAQVNIEYSISNLLRYGSGEENVNRVVTRRDYFENLTEARLTVGEFLLGFRLLHDAPPEFGQEFTGIRKRYVEFRRDDLYVRAGDSFSLYGRGMALNLFENRALGFDTGVDGVKMEYATGIVKLGFTAGDINYLDILDLTRREEFRIRAGSVEVSPYPWLSVGFNFVSGKSRFPPPSFPDMHAQFDIPEYTVKASYEGIDFYAAYAEKRTTVYGDTLGTHRGTGFYGSASYAGESYGVSLEYKDYRFGIADPFDRDNRNRAKRALAFQNAPIVHKEHTFTLLSRYPHVIDLNDEVGFQVDVFATPTPQVTASVNFAASSRHYTFDPTGDSIRIAGVPFPAYGSKPRSTSWLPNFKPEFSPFWEFYADVQYYFEEGGTDNVVVGANRRFEYTVDEVLTPAKPKKSASPQYSTAIPISVQYTVADEWALKFTSERQWVHSPKETIVPDFYNHLFSIGVARSPIFSVTLRYEFTNQVGTVDGRKDWFAIDGSYRVSNNHTITLTAGGDRGGQICANGICRIVNPFLGFRASIVSYL